MEAEVIAETEHPWLFFRVELVNAATAAVLDISTMTLEMTLDDPEGMLGSALEDFDKWEAEHSTSPGDVS